MISVIIPVYNEEECLKTKKQYFQALSEKTELIFVDGQSTDKGKEIAERYGKVFVTEKGRARQMNAGAQAAQGDVFLFLHADAEIALEHILALPDKMREEGFVGGCFKQVLEGTGWLFKWIAFTGNARASWTRIYYGDQGLFVRSDMFKKIGGYPEMDIGEDIFFSRKLRQEGKTKMIPFPIYCSTRRWQHQGIWKTYVLNQWITLGMFFKVDSRRLSHHYHDVR